MSNPKFLLQGVIVALIVTSVLDIFLDIFYIIPLKIGLIGVESERKIWSPMFILKFSFITEVKI